MGTWGTALYSDDFASDIRDEFRDLVGEGVSAEDAIGRLVTEYSSVLSDSSEESVFWLALADTAWRLGRPVERATTEALRIIHAGSDLSRWDEERLRRKRIKVLEELALRLQSAPPPIKRVARRFIHNNSWDVGEVVGYRLASGAWTLLRVIGHHVDMGGRFAVCELLDWTGPNLDAAPQPNALAIRRVLATWRASQFMIGEPRKKSDLARFVRTGWQSTPEQQPGGYMVFPIPDVDSLLHEIFGLE
ncbi:MAG: hypothetical protein U0625_06990 [Phycisphaerales bacterium]